MATQMGRWREVLGSRWRLPSFRAGPLLRQTMRAGLPCSAIRCTAAYGTSLGEEASPPSCRAVSARRL